MTRLPALLACACACLAALPAADPSIFDTYTVVESAVATRLTDKGTGEIILRYVLKSATVQEIGGRWFIVGKTPTSDHVIVPGSNWRTLMIPMDTVRAMAGATEVADFVQERSNAATEPIGAPAALPAPSTAPAP
jgi:hypothetical protein